MTEIKDISGTAAVQKMPDSVEAFILHWGDMGGQWGVNRSVSQIHALLYLSEHPMAADEITDQLGIARSNVSNSLKELISWRLIKRVPVAGDRRDHYVAETDVWEIVTRIAEGRKMREIDPVAEVLEHCVVDAKSDPKVNPVALKRLVELLEFIQLINRWYEQMLKVPKGKAFALLKMGSRVLSLIPGGKQ